MRITSQPDNHVNFYPIELLVTLKQTQSLKLCILKKKVGNAMRGQRRWQSSVGTLLQLIFLHLHITD